jgi:HAD superfamily hydrolase (TIGR01509 family)
MPLKALIFDFDGIILDSETPEYQTWQRIYAQFGIDLPMHAWEKGMGSSLEAFDPPVYLEKCLGNPVDRPALREKQRMLLMDILGSQPPLPGVEKYLRRAKELGIKVAVASSSGIEWVRGNLDRLGLLHHIQVLCTKEDVKVVKPDPALYSLALSRLGVDADQAVAIEDSPNGIRAARAAGIFCLAVPTPVSRDLDLSQSNLVIPSLEALILDDLANLLN